MLDINISSLTSLDKYPARQHARRVAEQLSAKQGLIYLAGTPTRYLEDSDQGEPFRQRRYFYYLSGVDERDCHVTYDIAEDKLILWLPPISARQTVWIGRGSTVEEAEQKYDVDQARYTDKLEDYVKGSSWKTVYILHSNQSPPGIFSEYGHDKHNLLPAIAQARVIKDPHEIRLLQRANDISAEGHRAVLRNIAFYHNEAQVEATFTAVSISQGAKQGYSIIAGSGENGAVLHYGKNDEDFNDRQLMVLDAGAEWHNYAADVTRTFPLNGKMSVEAQAIYDIVQIMQNAALNMIKPGMSLLRAHLLCHLLVAEYLKKLGILRGGSAKELFDSGVTKVFYPHGLGHHLGLEVHDVTPPDSGVNLETFDLSEFETGLGPLSRFWRKELCGRNELREPCGLFSGGLQPGMVVTVEPGIYFNKYALEKFVLPDPELARYIDAGVVRKYIPVGGVRIEDDILITEGGWRNLTTAPKGEEALKIIRGDK